MPAEQAVRKYDHLQNAEYNFVPFSQIPQYRDANRSLLRKVVRRLPDNFVHVDPGSGTGLVAREMIGLLHGEKKGRIICVEPDEYAISQAKDLMPHQSDVEVIFIQGFAQDLESLVGGYIPDNGVDSVSMHDAIHEIRGRDEKLKALRAEFNIGKRGAYYTWNSAFTTEGMGEDAMGYGRWIRGAFTESGGRTKRVRDRSDIVDDKTKIYEPYEYLPLFSEVGFKYLTLNPRTVILTNKALVAIARYPRFAEGAYENFEPGEDGRIPSIEKMSADLVKVAIENKIGPLVRIWNEYTAIKPFTASRGKAAA